MAKLYSSAPRISANPRDREIHFEKGVAEVTDLEAADLLALNSPGNELFSTKPFGGEEASDISEIEREALNAETRPVVEEKPKVEEKPAAPKAPPSRKKAGARKKSTKKSRR